jgi:alanine racemase
MNIAPDPKSIPQGTLLSPEANQAATLATATGVLTVDLDAIVANWRKLEKTAVPAECAGVVKADAYGCGAEQVARALSSAGCKTFFVATSMRPAWFAPRRLGPQSTCSTASSRTPARPTPGSTASP